MSDPNEGIEQRAERAVRRGDLLAALDAFERLLAIRPDDERLRGRIESVRSLLQPSELVHRRKADALPEAASEATLNDAEQGELHATNGRYELAVQCYRRAVDAHPKNELLRERLSELFRLAPPTSRAVDDGLSHAEPLEAPTAPIERPQSRDARSSRAADATFRPVPPSLPPVAPSLPPVAPSLPPEPLRSHPPLPSRTPPPSVPASAPLPTSPRPASARTPPPRPAAPAQIAAPAPAQPPPALSRPAAPPFPPTRTPTFAPAAVPVPIPPAPLSDPPTLWPAPAPDALSGAPVLAGTPAPAAPLEKPARRPFDPIELLRSLLARIRAARR